MVNVDLQIANNRMSKAAAELLKKNIMFFCNTPKGSLPQRRGFGLDWTMFDDPFPTFRARATVDILRGIQNEYGVRLSTIDISADNEGGVKVKISI